MSPRADPDPAPRCCAPGCGSSGATTGTSRSGSTRRTGWCVEDRPDVRRVLARLAAGSPVAAGPAADRVVAQLLGRGCWSTPTCWTPPWPGPPGAAGRGAGVLACFARHGDAAAAPAGGPRERPGPARRPGRGRRDGRPACCAPPASARWRSPPARGGRPAAAAAAVVALVVARASRPGTDWTRSCARGVPHLLLTVSADGVRPGPFVVPGVTACLRCLDAHRSERDPRRATVLRAVRPRRRGRRRPGPGGARAGRRRWATSSRFVDGDRPRHVVGDGRPRRRCRRWCARGRGTRTAAARGTPCPRRREAVRRPGPGRGSEVLAVEPALHRRAGARASRSSQ